ncbi:hypothetical protein ACFQO4_01105 [Saliphagus sp. GCM10025334]
MTFDVILNEYCAPEHGFDGTDRDEQADPVTAPSALVSRTVTFGTLETPENPAVPEGRQ